MSSSWLRKPTTSMPSSETPSLVRRSRTASGSAPATVRRRPLRRWISGHARSSTCRPFRASWRPAKTMRCSRSAGRRGLGNEHAVREHVVLAREPAVLRDARTLGDGDPVVDPIHQESPDRRSESQPAELARGVEGRDERCSRHDERGRADRRCHRLVQVEHVEALVRRARGGSGRSSSARARCWGASRSPAR